MAEPKPPPPWLFALTGMPYGVVGSFTGVIMPFLARDAGIEVGDIGWFVTLLFLPTILLFFCTRRSSTSDRPAGTGS